MGFCEIIGFTKQIYVSYEIMCFTKQIYEDKSLSQNHVFIFRISSFSIKSSILLNKFTKTSPYRKTTFSLLEFQGLRLLYFY